MGGSAGDRLPQDPQLWLTVTGVASGIVQDLPQPGVKPLVYLPYTQVFVPAIQPIARTQVAPQSLAPAFRAAIQEVDGEVSIGLVNSLEESLDRVFWRPEFNGILFAAFAAIALLLASVGFYAVIANTVSRRTQEIGVRMAIGASSADIRFLVLRQALAPLAWGISLGVPAALAVNRLLKAQLIDVAPSDPLTLVAVSVVLVIASVSGCWIPVRRAMRVDPIIALRQD